MSVGTYTRRERRPFRKNVRRPFPGAHYGRTGHGRLPNGPARLQLKETTMKHRRLALLSASLAMMLVAAVALAADSYQVDPIHSVIIFRIKHLDVGMFYGRFNGPQGTFTYDEQDPSKSSFQFTVKAKDFDSGNVTRDQHVRGPEFLNAPEFPDIIFKSKSVKRAGGDGANLEVTGDLTLHGQTRPVTVTLEKTGAA